MTQATTPMVSVIIPTYNRAALLGEAVQSVLCQTFDDFELIVVDDGSTDNTPEVMQAFDDARLIHVRQENRGRSAARNRAIGLAKGRYIAFLDSDDLYLKGKLQQQVALLNARPDIDMIYTAAICVDEKGVPLERQVYQADAEGDIYRQVAFFRPVTITLPTVMIRREVLEVVGPFDERMERFEDTDLWRRIAKRFRIGVISEPTCILRTHSDNELASQDPQKITSAIGYYIAKIMREDGDVDRAFLKAGAAGLLEYYGRAFLTIPGWRRQGFLLLRKAIRFQPLRVLPICLAALRTLLGAAMRSAFGIAQGTAK